MKEKLLYEVQQAYYKFNSRDISADALEDDLKWAYRAPYIISVLEQHSIINSRGIGRLHPKTVENVTCRLTDIFDRVKDKLIDFFIPLLEWFIYSHDSEKKYILAAARAKELLTTEFSLPQRECAELIKKYGNTIELIKTIENYGQGKLLNLAFESGIMNIRKSGINIVLQMQNRLHILKLSGMTKIRAALLLNFIEENYDEYDYEEGGYNKKNEWYPKLSEMLEKIINGAVKSFSGVYKFLKNERLLPIIEQLDGYVSMDTVAEDVIHEGLDKPIFTSEDFVDENDYYDYFAELLRGKVIDAWRRNIIYEDIQKNVLTVKQTIEFIKKNKDSENFGNRNAALQAAINTCHTSGSIMEYISNYYFNGYSTVVARTLYRAFDKLSNGGYKKEWYDDIRTLLPGWSGNETEDYE